MITYINYQDMYTQIPKKKKKQRSKHFHTRKTSLYSMSMCCYTDIVLKRFKQLREVNLFFFLHLIPEVWKSYTERVQKSETPFENASILYFSNWNYILILQCSIRRLDPPVWLKPNYMWFIFKEIYFLKWIFKKGQIAFIIIRHMHILFAFLTM